MHNKLIAIRNNTKDEYIKRKAELLLNQLCTAGGKNIIRKEIELFIEQNS